MNDTIIDRCNEVVKPDDTLYYLGDFCFALNGKLDPVYEFLRRINCERIHFILGNHDHVIKKNRYKLVENGWFLSINDVYYVNDTKPSVFLSHYAHRVWDGCQYGKFHLYGHSHGSLEELDDSLSFDVGINCNNYYPVSYEEVKERMSRKKFVPLDHHT